MESATGQAALNVQFIWLLHLVGRIRYQVRHIAATQDIGQEKMVTPKGSIKFIDSNLYLVVFT
jgi:hypothetical protein